MATYSTHQKYAAHGQWQNSTHPCEHASLVKIVIQWLCWWKYVFAANQVSLAFLLLLRIVCVLALQRIV